MSVLNSLMNTKRINNLTEITGTSTTKTTNLKPNFWGQLWILNRLVRVGHKYSFFSILFYLKPYSLLLP